MIFNSIDFLLFLPLVFFIYWLIPQKKIGFQNVLLLVASYVFYGWWDWRFLSLILFSTIIDYSIGRRLEFEDKGENRKLLLWISIIVNLGFLGFFKYYNFFVDSFRDAFTILGFEFSPWTLSIILPVGISFYTFQTLSYTIDVFKRKLEPEKDFIAFATFVSFFPQLVAGPIERASNLLPQFKSQRSFSNDMISSGVKLIIIGFFMKVVVADRAAIYVNVVYNNPSDHGGLTFIVATLMFAFQIYGDFAGYSLIAIGTAKLFGFGLMNNFNRPYFATSVGEFWQRWHISLSTWFRDYVYIPLGGNRVAKGRWLANLFITFLLSGLWHGANWTFIIWGGLNGVFLIIEALTIKSRKGNIFNVIITFVLINFTWIFFRSNSIGDAIYALRQIVTNPGKLYIGDGSDIVTPIFAIIGIIILLICEVKKEYFNSIISLSNNKYQLIRISFYSLIVFTILYLGVFGESQFIYFQF